MKKLAFLLILFAACKSPGKKVAAVLKDTLQKAKPADTTFLLKEVRKDFYHAVYIEKGRSSEPYRMLLNFKFDKLDIETYKGYEAMKVKNGRPLKKYNLEGLPNYWVPLHSYKGKYYLYLPNDFGYAARRIVTDSTLIYWAPDGPAPGALSNFKKLGANKYTLKSIPFYHFARPSTITIYIIDPQNKIAVWKDTALSNDDRYRLYVPLQCAKNFDMIVNHCETEVTPEFDFEKIDYKALIKGL